jgi:hypothetical protein
MSDEKASQMNISIGKRVRWYVVYFTLLILTLLWGNEALKLASSSLAINTQQSELRLRIAESVFTALLAAASFLLNLGRDIDLHNLLDSTFFHVRRRTGQIIEHELIQAAQSVGANGWVNMKGKQRELMHLFYHFVNAQTELRALAFTYWEQYFVNLYVICLGSLGCLISLSFVLIRRRFDVAPVVFAVFLFITTAVAASTRYRLVRKIYDLPVQQVNEMLSGQNAVALKAEVETRFGGIVTGQGDI